MTGTGIHHVRVRYAETDQMGVAHHGSYIPWLEEARTEWMRERGHCYRDMERAGLSLAVTSVSIRYRESARYDDVIRIETRLVERRKASVVIAYRLFLAPNGVDHEPGPLLAEAETRLALIGANGRPRRLPDELFST